MNKKQAKRVLSVAAIAERYARDFAAYFGDAISGPLVSLDAESFNEVVDAWESQGVTKMLIAHIQNAIIAATKEKS